MMANQDQQLDELLGCYRAACPEIEPGANFMPGVWARIDVRRKSEQGIVRWATWFAMVAAMFVMVLGIMMYRNPNPLPQRAYIEKLTDEISEDHFLEAAYVAKAKPAKFWGDR
ncbi:MAG: hypothetical protein FJW36_22170 [Acidobacteria bacterium]|nr:hypothetical protein [Acidobacteriota bacterium]